MSGDASVVRSVYEAFASADVEGIIDALADDVVLEDPDLPGGGIFSGVDSVLGFLRQWGDTFDELTVELEELIDAGDGRVVAVVHQKGVSKTGVAVEMHDAHVWTVRDGKVARIQMFLSREAALAAAQTR